MACHHMGSFRDYYQYVLEDPAGAVEWQLLVELLVNHETSFFRHAPSFAALTQYVLPELIQHADRAQTIVMWSAGCSMGHEAYSLAMACLEVTQAGSAVASYGLHPNTSSSSYAVRIRGSDISRRALRQARIGRYRWQDVRALPAPYLQQYFTVVGEGQECQYEVVDNVKAVVEFSYINLYDLESSPSAPLPYMGGKDEGVDIIFCQNVLIYFPPETRVQIAQPLCQRLRPGGYLFLGPAEATGLELRGMRTRRCAGALIHQRIDKGMSVPQGRRVSQQLTQDTPLSACRQ
jgi:chemotaxis methyl-accepting protein methylase